VGDGPEFHSVNPATGARLASTPSAGPEQVKQATSAAYRAFEGGEWSRLSGKDRSHLLYALADLIERDEEDLLELFATEVGTPVRQGRALHVELPAEFIRWFAEAARRGPRDGLEQPLPLHHNPVTSSSILVRDPIGVVAAVTAYNFPLIMCAFKIGAALAAGCSSVLVPSPKALLSTIAFVKLAEEAGFPAGAVNLVFGSPAVVEQVVTAEEVALVSFTGSAAVGSRIMELAAPTLKKVVLELGGKSPNIVLPGADISTVGGQSVQSFCFNSGQACGASARALVWEQDFDNYVEAAANTLRAMTVGDPLQEETEVGPLISDAHRRSVEEYVMRAAEVGASVVAGGQRPSGLESGFFLEPTLVVGVGNDAEINQEEIFGPVGAVIPYQDLDEVVRIANDSKYALNANIWGPTVEAIELARRLRTGTVVINGGGGMRADAPWGGPGFSGIGREVGEEGYREFFEVKHIQWVL
jgi:aldehyde dehydrogenase (NAD+)/betaine-aldehyde dehydrogenase